MQPEAAPTLSRAWPGTHTAMGSRFVDGMRACVPIILGYVAVGLAFGVVARTSGLSPLEVGLMSLILYAGSSQFVAVSLLAGGASVSAIVVAVLLVNIRHLLYSAALAPRLHHLPTWQSTLVGSETTDETFAVIMSHQAGHRPRRARWFFGLNLTAHATWIAATTIGALVGRAIPDTRALGLDFALAAMFAALLILQIANQPRQRTAVLVACVAAVVAVGGAQVVSASWAVIAAAAAAATCGAVLEGA